MKSERIEKNENKNDELHSKKLLRLSSNISVDTGMINEEKKRRRNKN